MEWEEVNLDAGELWVRNGPELGFSPKTARQGAVPLPPELAGELRSRGHKSGWVLEGERGGHMKFYRIEMH